MSVWITPAWSDDVQRSDLAGDGHIETIKIVKVLVQGEMDDILTVDSRTINFGKSGGCCDLPDPAFKIIHLSLHSRRHQILSEYFDPDRCEFHVIAYAEHQLHDLLTLGTGPDCSAPTVRGNDTVTVGVWEGFWDRPQTYRFSPDEASVKLEPQTIHRVHRSAKIVQSVHLQQAGCKSVDLVKGDRTTVVEFDATKDMYLLASDHGACGWRKQDFLSHLMPGLGWSG